DAVPDRHALLAIDHGVALHRVPGRRKSFVCAGLRTLLEPRELCRIHADEARGTRSRDHGEDELVAYAVVVTRHHVPDPLPLHGLSFGGELRPRWQIGDRDGPPFRKKTSIAHEPTILKL